MKIEIDLDNLNLKKLSHRAAAIEAGKALFVRMQTPGAEPTETQIRVGSQFIWYNDCDWFIKESVKK